MSNRGATQENNSRKTNLCRLKRRKAPKNCQGMLEKANQPLRFNRITMNILHCINKPANILYVCSYILNLFVCLSSNTFEEHKTNNNDDDDDNNDNNDI